MPVPSKESIIITLRDPNLTVDRLSALFNQGLTTSAVLTSEKRTPLHLVAQAGNLACVRYLVEQRNANLEDRDKDGMTALGHAAYQARADVVRYLLDRGADIKARDFYRRTPLHVAISSGCLDTVRLLLDRGASEGPLPSIMRAALEGHTAIIELLLSRGRDVNASDGHGWNALDYAIDRGHAETVSFLLDRGATFRAHHGEKRPPTHGAASSGCTENLRLLLDRGLPVLSIRDDQGLTVLHKAVMCNQVEALRFLLDRGGDVDARSYTGLTPLHAAIKGRSIESLRLLLSRKASLEKYVLHLDQDGKRALTPLGLAGSLCAQATDAALFSGYENVIRVLVEHIDASPDPAKLYLMPSTNCECSYATMTLASTSSPYLLRQTLLLTQKFPETATLSVWMAGRHILSIHPSVFEFSSLNILMTIGWDRIISGTERSHDWSIGCHRFLDLFPSSSLRPFESEQDAVYVEALVCVLRTLRYKKLYKLLTTIRAKPHDSQSGIWRDAFRAGRDVQRRVETLLAIAVGRAPPSADRKRGDASTAPSASGPTTRADLEAKLKAMRGKLASSGGRR